MGVAAFAFGAFVTSHGLGRGRGIAHADIAASPALCRVLRIVTWALFGIAVAAYAIWFMPVARDPSILLAVLSGRWAELQIRETIGTIPGVTTLVQAQLPYVTLLVLRWLYIPGAQPTGWKSRRWASCSCWR